MKREEEFKDVLDIYEKYHKARSKFENLKTILSTVEYPEWIVKKWLVLHRAFDDQIFTLPEATKVLRCSEDSARSIMSELVRRELMVVRNHPKDARKKHYVLLTEIKCDMCGSIYSVNPRANCVVKPAHVGNRIYLCESCQNKEW